MFVLLVVGDGTSSAYQLCSWLILLFANAISSGVVQEKAQALEHRS